MARITKRLVDAATSGGKERDTIWDDDVKGFGLRVTASGSKSYILNYRIGGRERRATIGTHGSPWTPDEARQRAREMLRAIADGIDPLEVKAADRKAMTVAGLWEFYNTAGRAARPNKKASSWDNDRTMFERHIIPLIGKRTVKSLTKADVSKMQADIAAGKTAKDERTGTRGRAIVRGGESVAAHAVVALKSAINLAAREIGITSNPAAEVELFKAKKRQRFLSELEVTLIGEALNRMQANAEVSDTFADSLRLLMLTGCRRDEILGLEWEWVDLGRGLVNFPDSKTGAKATVLSEAAMEILRHRRAMRRNSAYVFPSRLSDDENDKRIVGVRKVWLEVRAKAAEIGKEAGHDINLDDVRIHDLRHSFASFAVSSGSSLPVIGAILGHRQTSTTAGYAHLHDDPVRQAADATAAKIAAALSAGVKEGRST